MTTNDAIWSEHPCYKQDPFPGIEAALLNSADIARYVRAGCLIEESDFDFERMKPASYEMRFLGELYDWRDVDGRLQKRCRKIAVDDLIELGKNSISYLWTKERLLLPEYIAARFNLRIREVHKGILLGTGPLIDPGFGGQILIPLHNLTDNDYKLRGGDGIIWVEFTKVSKNDYWTSSGEENERPPDLVPFPSDKVINDPHGYLDKAGVLALGGVQSVFKETLNKARRVADDAKNVSSDADERVTELEGLARRWGFGGAFFGVAAVVAIVIAAFNLTFPVMDEVRTQSERIGELEERFEDMVEAQSNGLVVAPAEEAGQGPALEAVLTGRGRTVVSRAKEIDKLRIG